MQQQKIVTTKAPRHQETQRRKKNLSFKFDVRKSEKGLPNM